jgi:hypothetical protein
VSDELLPSLSLISAQVAAEREAMNSHAESLDSKAGVVLGFAGVVVGLGATAPGSVSSRLVFQLGLVVGVLAGALAAWAFLPRRYPVIEVLRLRDRYLTASEEVTRLHLRRVQASVVCLAGAAFFVVAGTLIATGGGAHA